AGAAHRREIRDVGPDPIAAPLCPFQALLRTGQRAIGCANGSSSIGQLTGRRSWHHVGKSDGCPGVEGPFPQPVSMSGGKFREAPTGGQAPPSARAAPGCATPTHLLLY